MREKVRHWVTGHELVSLNRTVIRCAPKDEAGEGCINKPVPTLRLTGLLEFCKFSAFQFTERKRDSPKDTEPPRQGSPER